jgi:Tfp pilus assembly protein PilF
MLVSCKHTPTPEEVERAQVQRDMGANAMHAGNHRMALAELLKGEQLNPDDAEIQYALGLTYFTGFGRLKEAEHHLHRAASLQPDYSDAYNGLGSVAMAKGQCERAIPLFEKALSNLLWPTPFQAEQNLGWCRYKLGQTDKAIAHLKSAVNMNPHACGAMDTLGQIFVDTQKDLEVVKWLERYVKTCDSDKIRKFIPPDQLAWNYYRLGMAYARTGDRGRAQELLGTCTERFAEQEAGAECRKSVLLVRD